MVGLFAMTAFTLFMIEIAVISQPADPGQSSKERTDGIWALVGNLVVFIIILVIHVFGFFVAFRDYDYVNVYLDPESKLPKV